MESLSPSALNPAPAGFDGAAVDRHMPLRPVSTQIHNRTMIDPKTQLLARIVIVQAELVLNLTKVVSNVVERRIEKGDDFDGRGGILLSDIEQLEAALRPVPAHLDSLRDLFELPQD